MTTFTVGSLFAHLWDDDCGAVLASEYLTLGTVVVLGGVAGLTTLRDSVNDEMKEFGGSIRSMRQSYSVAGQRSGVASVAGSSSRDGGNAGNNSKAPDVTTSDHAP